MKFCYEFTLPKHSSRSRSVLYDRSRAFNLFWKEKTLSYSRRNMVYMYRLSVHCLRKRTELENSMKFLKSDVNGAYNVSLSIPICMESLNFLFLDVIMTKLHG